LIHFQRWETERRDKLDLTLEAESAKSVKQRRAGSEISSKANTGGKVMHAIRGRLFRKFVVLAGLAMAVLPAAAQDKVSVGVMTVSSSLPYFVALDQGFFTEQHIETEMTKLMGGPPNIAAMITNQIDVAAVLVTIEGMNANLKKPGVAMFIALDGQNSVYQMDQIVARNGFKADSLKDLKGAKLLSAPGPANLAMARAALAAVGLKDGDYSIDQLDMALHVGALKAGTYDGGYTLEPNASIMRKLGIARTLEAGCCALRSRRSESFCILRRMRDYLAFYRDPAGGGEAVRCRVGESSPFHQRSSGGGPPSSGEERACARGYR